jgi:hypothetical protein
MQLHGPRGASPQKAHASHCKHAKGIPPCSNGNGTRLISRWASATPCLLDPATLKSFMQIAEYFRDIITKAIQRAGTLWLRVEERHAGNIDGRFARKLFAGRAPQPDPTVELSYKTRVCKVFPLCNNVKRLKCFTPRGTAGTHNARSVVPRNYLTVCQRV